MTKSAKRTRTLALGSLAAGLSVGLTACDAPAPPGGDYAFQNLQQCTDAGFQASTCREKLDEAIKVHAAQAPRFQSLESCEKEYGEGKCGSLKTEGQTSQGFFSPFLTGFLLSQVIGNVAGNRAAAYRGGPIYRTAGGRPVAIPPTGNPGAGRATPQPLNASTRSAARSGFGGRTYQRAGGSRGGFGRGFGG